MKVSLTVLDGKVDNVDASLTDQIDVIENEHHSDVEAINHEVEDINQEISNIVIDISEMTIAPIGNFKQNCTFI